MLYMKQQPNDMMSMNGINNTIIRKDYIMKKLISALLIIATVSILLVSCGGSSLSGTYRCDDEYPDIEGDIYKIKFDGDKCTIYDSICGYGVLDWKVEDGKLRVWGDADLGIFDIEIDYEYEFTKDGNSIFLDGVEFKKQ